MKNLFWVIASVFFIIAGIVNFILNNNSLGFSFISLSIALAIIGFYSSKRTK